MSAMKYSEVWSSSRLTYNIGVIMGPQLGKISRGQVCLHSLMISSNGQHQSGLSSTALLQASTNRISGYNLGCPQSLSRQSGWTLSHIVSTWRVRIFLYR